MQIKKDENESANGLAEGMIERIRDVINELSPIIKEKVMTSWESTRKKFIHEELPNNSETEDMRKIR